MIPVCQVMLVSNGVLIITPSETSPVTKQEKPGTEIFCSDAIAAAALVKVKISNLMTEAGIKNTLTVNFDDKIKEENSK